MNPKPSCSTSLFRPLLAIVCAIAIAPGDAVAYSQSAAQPAQQNDAVKIPADELDSLVSPIALYPDPLLAQVLAASTYPLELVQLQQWLTRNQGLKDKALADAAAKQPWDPSIQAMAGLPDLVKRLTDDIQWTTDLGNAFLAQEADVMAAIQRMRNKAMEKGTLKSNEQQKVETQVVENKKVIVIEQANPQVVYVPSYDPTVVYGPPVYPYPPIYYPPYYPGALAISFGVGLAMGAFWGGGWGWGCGWGGNNVTVNNFNNFNRNTNINGGNRTNISGGNRASQLPSGGRGNRGNNGWSHNPQHRGGAPYRDRATADRFGGNARGDSVSNRQANARRQVGQQGGRLESNRPGGGGGNRAANRGGTGVGDRSGVGNRSGGANNIGGRDVSRGGGGNRDAFGGGSRGSKGYNGASARSSSNRGASSMRSGGGGRRGGGGGRRR